MWRASGVSFTFSQPLMPSLSLNHHHYHPYSRIHAIHSPPSLPPKRGNAHTETEVREGVMGERIYVREVGCVNKRGS